MDVPGSDASWCLGLGALALLLRALHWQLTAVLFNDGPIFLELAGAIRDGDWAAALAHDYHPLYPALTGMLARVGVDLEVAAVAVSVFGGVLATVFAFLWLRDSFGATAARIGGLIVAFHPYAIRFAGDVQSDGLYLGLFFVGLYAGWRLWQAADLRFALLAGAAAGAAYLVRPEGAGLALIAAAGLLSLLRTRPAASRWLACAAGLVVACALAMAPYVTWLSVDAGTPMLSRKKAISVLVAGRRPDPTDAPAARTPPALDSDAQPAADPDAHALAPAAAFESMPPVAAGPKYRESLLDLGNTWIDGLRYELFLCLLAGLWVARGRPGARAWFALLGVVLWGSVLFGLRAHAGYLSSRHVLPPALLVLGWVALGVPVIGRGIAAGLSRLRPSAAPVRAGVGVAIALALVSGLLLGKGMRPFRQNAAVERSAAEWVAERNPSAEPVGAIKRRVGYYARSPYVDIRLAHPSRFPEFVVERELGWIVVDEDEKPQLDAMLAGAPGLLALVHAVERRGEYAYVYRRTP